MIDVTSIMAQMSSPPSQSNAALLLDDDIFKKLGS